MSRQRRLYGTHGPLVDEGTPSPAGTVRTMGTSGPFITPAEAESVPVEPSSGPPLDPIPETCRDAHGARLVSAARRMEVDAINLSEAVTRWSGVYRVAAPVLVELVANAIDWWLREKAVVPSTSPVEVEVASPAQQDDVVLHRCASPFCPGYPYKASDQRHPGSTCGPVEEQDRQSMSEPQPPEKAQE